MNKILIVEDEATIALQLEERLTRMGYEVVGRTTSGLEAIDLSKRLNPDVVLMDIVMPGEMDGIEASIVIKEESDIPVIFLTAYSEDYFINRAKLSEPFAYIVKPFQEREVKAAIEIALYRRKVAEQLRVEERRFHAVVDYANDAIISFDANGDIFFWNKMAEDLFGSLANERLGTPFASILKEESREAFRKMMKESSLAEAHKTSKELKGINARGGELCIDASLSSWESGGERFYTSVLRDISDRKHTEQALIQSERLRMASELSAGICHNLNNILTGISGPASLLQQKTRDPELLNTIELILFTSKRASDLINKLHLSVRGQRMENPYPVDLNEMVEQTLQLTQDRWKSRPECQGVGIHIRTDLGDVPLVRATEADMCGMIANLLFNSIEAMPDGGEIWIRTQIEGEFVQLLFRDTGIGMDAETCRKVFEPFFTTNMEVGRGLGLSTLRGTLTHWGGKAEVNSALEKGATFTLYFPLWREELKPV